MIMSGYEGTFVKKLFLLNKGVTVLNKIIMK